MSAKRRTRKQKTQAHHNFEIAWTGQASKSSVNSQNKLANLAKAKKNHKVDNANKSVIDANFEPIQKDLLRTLFVAGIIVAIQLVLYSQWK